MTLGLAIPLRGSLVACLIAIGCSKPPTGAVPPGTAGSGLGGSVSAPVSDGCTPPAFQHDAASLRVDQNDLYVALPWGRGEAKVHTVPLALAWIQHNDPAAPHAVRVWSDGVDSARVTAVRAEIVAAGFTISTTPSLRPPPPPRERPRCWPVPGPRDALIGGAMPWLQPVSAPADTVVDGVFTDEVDVMFRRGATFGQINDALASVGGAVTSCSPDGFSATVILKKRETPAELAAIVTKLNASPGIAHAMIDRAMVPQQHNLGDPQ